VNYFLTAKAFGLTGLESGEKIKITSDEMSGVVIKPDVTVRNAPDGEASIASGTFSFASGLTSPPVITFKAEIYKSDDTPSGTKAITDTVTIDHDVHDPQGTLFGVNPHPPAQLFRCPTCEKSFTSKDGLELHDKSCGSQEQERQPATTTKEPPRPVDQERRKAQAPINHPERRRTGSVGSAGGPPVRH